MMNRKFAAPDQPRADVAGGRPVMIAAVAASPMTLVRELPAVWLAQA